MGANDNDEDWVVELSDEEMYNENGEWEPSPAEIVQLYKDIEAGKKLTLQWNWPRGRRSPTPEKMDVPENKPAEPVPEPKQEK